MKWKMEKCGMWWKCGENDAGPMETDKKFWVNLV